MLHAQLKKHKVRPLKQISIWHAHTCMKNWPQSPSTLSGWMDCWQGARPHCPTSVPHLNNVLGGWVAANPCSRHPKPCGQHSHGTGRVLGMYIWTSSTGVNILSRMKWKWIKTHCFFCLFDVIAKKHCLRPIQQSKMLRWIVSSSTWIELGSLVWHNPIENDSPLHNWHTVWSRG